MSLQISHKTNSGSRRRMSSGNVTFPAMDDTFCKELINPLQREYILHILLFHPVRKLFRLNFSAVKFSSLNW